MSAFKVGELYVITSKNESRRSPTRRAEYVGIDGAGAHVFRALAWLDAGAWAEDAPKGAHRLISLAEVSLKNYEIAPFEDPEKYQPALPLGLRELPNPATAQGGFRHLAEMFGASKVRMAIRELDGERCFYAGDLCRAIGIKNVSDALSRIDPEDVIDLPNQGDPNIGGSDVRTTLHPTVKGVTEGGMYALVQGSNKDEAKAFKRWITHEVLPKLRRTGSYSTTPPASEVKSAVDHGAETLRVLTPVLEMFTAAQRQIADTLSASQRHAEERETKADAVAAENARMLRMLVEKIVGGPSAKLPPLPADKLKESDVIEMLGLREVEGSNDYVSSQGERRGRLKAGSVNRLALGAGLKFALNTKGGVRYYPTDKGRTYVIAEPFDSKRENGASFENYHWHPSVVPLLDAELTRLGFPPALKEAK